jgi:TolB protein
MKIVACILAALVAVGFGANAGQAQSLPTGTIVFNSGGEISAFKVTGSSVTRLTFTSDAESNPKISPDGCKIVFNVSLSGKGGGGIAIDIMSSNGSGRRRLLTSGGGVASWSPNNKTIAFGSDSVWVLDTSAATPVPVRLIDHGNWPVFSPDGTKIVFSSQKPNRRDYDLWIMNADGSNAQLLLGFSGADIDVGGWSSNGLVFAHSGYDIYTYNPVTLELKRLTTTRENDYEPGWSPDGTMITFASLRTPEGIYMMNATDGSGQRWLTSGRQPSWGPDCVSAP